MLWNSEILLMSYPRAATKSLNLYFAQVLQKPVYGYLSRGHFKDIDKLDKNVFLEVGRGHENLRMCTKRLELHGRSLSQFKAILLPVRNPYDLMVSNYFFMRSSNPPSRENLNFKLARESDFTGFCRHFKPASFENWATLSGGVQPKNLRLIRYEHLKEDLTSLKREFSLQGGGDIPHLNATERGDYIDYLTREAEQVVFEKMDFLFQLGGYERVDNDKLSS